MLIYHVYTTHIRVLKFKNIKIGSLVWWLTPLIPTLGELRWVNCHKFEACLCHMETLSQNNIHTDTYIETHIHTHNHHNNKRKKNNKPRK